MSACGSAWRDGADGRAASPTWARLPPRRAAPTELTAGRALAAFLATHPEVRAPDPHLAATVLVQTIEALTHRLVVHGAAEAQPAQAREMVALATAYLTADRSGPGRPARGARR